MSNIETNAHDIRNYNSLVELAKLNGFKVGYSKNHYESLTLIPDVVDGVQSLPHYTADADCFCSGNVNELKRFLSGWYAAMTYSGMCINTFHKQMKSAEEKQRNKLLIDKLKGEVK